MVKVGIIGADSPLAGEIIRILIYHPETEIVSLYAPSLMGRNASSLHHGLIGETQFNFSDKINPDDTDLFIVCQKDELSSQLISALPELEEMKVISFGTDMIQDDSEEKFEIGLSEINRKALVRGARQAYIASPVAVPALIALAPLANYLLLNSDIEIEISLPGDIVSQLIPEKEESLIKSLLQERQTSFNGKIKMKISPDETSERTSLTKVSLNNSLSIEEIEKIYEQTYDDHNFTFLSRKGALSEEVEGTQKTLISIDKPTPDILELKVVADSRMRGGAGDAVHVLNLFFGLHEKTGLYLKPNSYFPRQ